jgi:C4-type Zn-finger protein
MPGSLAAMDVTTIEAALERIGEGLQEARMAAELLREGDVTAIAELDAVVDAIAREVAELKTRTSAASL